MTTTTEYVVQYKELVSDRPYEELVAAFEAGVGNGTEKFASVLRDALTSEDPRQVFESGVNDIVGHSGFIQVFEGDFTILLGFHGVPAKAKSWMFGNPVIAVSMAREDIRAAGHVPLQILIYEDEEGVARIGYELPSSSLGRFGNAAVTAVAHELDRKVAALVAEVAGVAA